MNTTCKRCGSEIVKLSFSEEQKLEIWGLIVQDFKLFAVRKIKDVSFELKRCKSYGCSYQ